MTIDPFDDPFSTDRDAANFISAAEAGNVPLVTALLEKDPDAIRYVSDMGFTPLLHAVLARPSRAAGRTPARRRCCWPPKWGTGML
jgi:ankyrin repeat protein